MKHPVQPLVRVDGVVRFQMNKVVRYLLDHGSLNLNDVEKQSFPQEDRAQFYQLIGTSVSAWGDYDFSDPRVEDALARLEEDESGKETELKDVEQIRAALQALRARIPEDLHAEVDKIDAYLVALDEELFRLGDSIIHSMNDGLRKVLGEVSEDD